MEPWALFLLSGLLTSVAHQGLGAATGTRNPPFLSHDSAREKAGQCPLGWNQDVRTSRVYCLSDDKCPGSEKCCTLGTLRICVQPAMVGHGYCPELCSTMREPCLVSCLDDTWCGPGEKCCRDDCHVHCMVSEPARPGICPREKVLPNGTPCADRCVDDRSCPTEYKCCFNGCGLECVNPRAVTTILPATPGSRPETVGWSSVAVSTPGQLIKGRLALPPPQKPGACPLPLRGSLGPCPEPALESCRDDFDCANTKKCCSIGCNTVCREPEEVRPGTCPPRTAGGRVVLECLTSTFCVKDSDCSQPREKCCWQSCGWLCMAAAGNPTAEPPLQRKKGKATEAGTTADMSAKYPFQDKAHRQSVELLQWDEM